MIGIYGKGCGLHAGFHLGGWGRRLPPMEMVLLKLIIDVDKCLTKCMSSESMHM